MRACERYVTPANTLRAPSDPLWTPAQRFRLDCKKPRQKGQASDYLAKECQIIATYPTSPEQQLCLRTSDNPPESIEGGIQRGRCDELAESFWNIRKWPRTPVAVWAGEMTDGRVVYALMILSGRFQRVR